MGNSRNLILINVIDFTELLEWVVLKKIEIFILSCFFKVDANGALGPSVPIIQVHLKGNVKNSKGSRTSGLPHCFRFPGNITQFCAKRNQQILLFSASDYWVEYPSMGDRDRKISNTGS